MQQRLPRRRRHDDSRVYFFFFDYIGDQALTRGGICFLHYHDFHERTDGWTKKDIVTLVPLYHTTTHYHAHLRKGSLKLPSFSSFFCTIAMPPHPPPRGESATARAQANPNPTYLPGLSTTNPHCITGALHLALTFRFENEKN